jgi:hypothetical protein
LCRTQSLISYVESLNSWVIARIWRIPLIRQNIRSFIDSYLCLAIILSSSSGWSVLPSEPSLPSFLSHQFFFFEEEDDLRDVD